MSASSKRDPFWEQFSQLWKQAEKLIEANIELERRVAEVEARLPPKYEGPVWICGHHHPTRDEAAKCSVYQAQRERMPS